MSAMPMTGDRPSDTRFQRFAAIPSKRKNGSFFSHYAMLGRAAHAVASEAHTLYEGAKNEGPSMADEYRAAPTYAKLHGHPSSPWRAWAQATGATRLGRFLAGGVKADLNAARGAAHLLTRPIPNVVPASVRHAPGYHAFLSNPAGLGGVFHDLTDPLAQFLAKPSVRTGAPLAAMAIPVGPRPIRGEGMKLSNAEIASRPWFRGDAVAWEKPNPAQFDPMSVFGPALYLTDSGKVAESYIGKGAEDLAGVQRVEGKPSSQNAYVGIRNLRRNTNRYRVEQALADYQGKGFDVSNLRRGFRKPGERVYQFDFQHPRAGGVMRSFDLSRVTNTLHEHTPPSPRQARAIRGVLSSQDALQKAMGPGGDAAYMQPWLLSAFDKVMRSRNPTGQYVWGQVKNEAGLEPQSMVNALRQAGIQGMQYHGGQRQGGLGSHTAMALYAPELAFPNPGFVKATSPMASRAAEALYRYQQKARAAADRLSAAGAQQGGSLVDPRAYTMQDLYGLARVYGRQHPTLARTKNQDLLDAYMAAFIHAAQKKQQVMTGAELKNLSGRFGS